MKINPFGLTLIGGLLSRPLILDRRTDAVTKTNVTKAGDKGNGTVVEHIKTETTTPGDDGLQQKITVKVKEKNTKDGTEIKGKVTQKFEAVIPNEVIEANVTEAEDKGNDTVVEQIKTETATPGDDGLQQKVTAKIKEKTTEDGTEINGKITQKFKAVIPNA